MRLGAGRAMEQEIAESADARIQVGTRLKHARLTIGARLKDVAENAGCSESLLSKLENNKIRPSLNMLSRICDALNLTIGELFETPDAEETVVVREEARVVVDLASTKGTGLRMERLIPYTRGHLLQSSIHVLAPGGGSDGMVTHDGEEVGYVLAGTIELLLAEQTYRLKAGDSFIYRSETPHGYRNVGDDEARILFVNTPPTF